MADIDEKRKRLKAIQLDLKRKRLQVKIDAGEFNQPRTAMEKVNSALTDAPIKQDTSNIGGLSSAAIGFSEGMKDIGRGLGVVDQMNPEQTGFMKSLEEDRPITQTASRILGQVMPFVIGSIANPYASAGMAVRVGTAGALGATEGALISKGTGQDEQDILQSAGVGAAIGAGFEVAFPVIGRLSRSLYGKLKPGEKIVDSAGVPLPKFQQALDDAGIGFDDVKAEAANIAADSNPEQAARLADFNTAGVKATKGDLMQGSAGGFAQQAEEARLFGSSAEKLADPYRTYRLEQSNQFIDAVQKIMPDTDAGKSVGDYVKNALENDLAILKRQKNAFYKKAADGAESLGGIPVLTDSIKAAIPDNRTIASISGIDGNNVQSVKDLLTSYNVSIFDDSVDRLAAQGVKPTNLTLENFDEFRKALGRSMDSDKSGATAVLAGPVKDALDFEMDNLAENVLKNYGDNAPKEVVDSLKAARATVREIKTEFSPQSIAGKLIGTKSDRFTPSVEASKVYGEIVGSNKPIEFLQRTVKRLNGAGKEGTEAMKSLQAATIIDLLESSLKGQTRKVQGQAVFSPVAFNNRLNQIGADKMKLIFGGNTPEYKKVMQMGRIAKSITPPNEAVPKGSASVILDLSRKLGITTLSTKIPGLSLFAEAAEGLGESVATRKSVDRALRSVPDRLPAKISELEQIAPSLAAALAISTTATPQKQKEEVKK